MVHVLVCMLLFAFRDSESSNDGLPFVNVRTQNNDLEVGLMYRHV